MHDTLHIFSVRSLYVLTYVHTREAVATVEVTSICTPRASSSLCHLYPLPQGDCFLSLYVNLPFPEFYINGVIE